MAKTLSASSRRALIISLINEKQVHSQIDLVHILAEQGVRVTQATASRDLETIGAVRVKDPKGNLVYRFLLSEGSNHATSARISEELALTFQTSGNLVVIRTPPGGAHLLAGVIDRAMQSGELKGAIGTIAGDDTVLVVAKQAKGSAQLATRLKEFAYSNPKNRFRAK